MNQNSARINLQVGYLKDRRNPTLTGTLENEATINEFWHQSDGERVKRSGGSAWTLRVWTSHETSQIRYRGARR